MTTTFFLSPSSSSFPLPSCPPFGGPRSAGAKYVFRFFVCSVNSPPDDVSGSWESIKQLSATVLRRHSSHEVERGQKQWRAERVHFNGGNLWLLLFFIFGLHVVPRQSRRYRACRCIVVIGWWRAAFWNWRFNWARKSLIFYVVNVVGVVGCRVAMVSWSFLEFLMTNSTC